MSTPGGNGGVYGGEAQRRSAYVLTVTFFPDTGLVELGGACPTLELSKALYQMGADEAERQIQHQRQSQIVRATLSDLPTGRGSHG